MRFLLDTSVTIPLLIDYGEKIFVTIPKISLYILDLTIYEAGNSLWKLAYLLKKISIDDALEILDILIKLADKEIISVISFNEIDFSNTLELAYNKGITVYDASYITTAEKLKAMIVTEDDKLRKVAQRYVDVIGYGELKQIIK